MLFCSKGAVHISVDSDDPVRSRHLELDICVVWHCIESIKCGSSEQCVIAIAEGDDIEDQFFASEIIRGSEDHFECN